MKTFILTLLSIVLFTCSYAQEAKIEYILPSQVQKELINYFDSSKTTNKAKQYYSLLQFNSSDNLYSLSVVAYDSSNIKPYHAEVSKTNRFIKIGSSYFLPVMFEFDNEFIGYGEVNGRTKRIRHINEHPYTLIFTKKGEVVKSGYN